MTNKDELLSALYSLHTHQQQSEILAASMKSELAAMDLALLKGDQAAVEEIRGKLHNLVDMTVDHKWSAAQLVKKFKNFAD